MFRPHLTRCGLAFLLALLIVGCGPQYKLTPVEGVVKINGQPAPNISVQFMPDVLKGNKGPTSFAMTDAEGKFKLRTHDGRDGAVVGMHRAVLNDLEEERPPQDRPAKQEPRLEALFADPVRGLSVEVKVGGEPVVLEAKGPRR